MFKVFQASSPEVEVDGSTVLAVTSGILIADVSREVLECSGLHKVTADGWYPHNQWLQAYRMIHDMLGPDTLFSVGRRVPYSAQFPDEQMFNVPSALASIDVAYHLAHRNGDIGCYRYMEIGPDHYEVHCDNPYPNEFNLGIVMSLVERFRGRMQFEVGYRQAAEDPERDNASVIKIVRV